MQQAIKFLQFKNGKFWEMVWKKWNFDFFFYVFLYSIHFATAETTFANIGLNLALYIENILHL